jgi:transposase-like protein
MEEAGMLVELSVVEQRYRIVLAVVEDRLPVTEVAAEHGVSRQTVHTWLQRYRSGGLAALADRRRGHLVRAESWSVDTRRKR